jgi:hypothetical protein
MKLTCIALKIEYMTRTGQRCSCYRMSGTRRQETEGIIFSQGEVKSDADGEMKIPMTNHKSPLMFKPKKAQIYS